jgi:hypothetical protein
MQQRLFVILFSYFPDIITTESPAASVRIGDTMPLPIGGEG